MSLNWVKTARHGGGVQRTHTIPYTIQRSYSNAEHTFNAIIIAKAICDDLPLRVSMEKGRIYAIREGKIILYLIKHDLAECYTGDMPANFKKETAVKSLLDEVEANWEMCNLPAEYESDLNPFERLIAKIADSLELAMFCIDEYQMGNRHEVFLYMVDRIKRYILEVVDDSPSLSGVKTIIKIKEELDKCL